MQAVAEFRTKRAVALDMLRESIITQEIAPGSRLILEDISKQFGLSMTPVREALRALEAEGLVVQIAHKGAVVTAMDLEEILELYAMRSGLEAMVAARAVRRLTDDDLAKMEDAVCQMNERKGDWVAFLEQDKQFHTILYRAAGSQRWLDSVDMLWRRCSRYMFASTAMAGAETAIGQDHVEIIAACKLGDAEEVSNSIVSHLNHSRDRLLNDWVAGNT